MTSLSWDSSGGMVKHLSHSKTVQNMKDTHTSKSKCDAQVPCSVTRTYQYRKAMLQFSWHMSHRNIWWIPSYTSCVFQKYFMVSSHPAQPYWVIFCLAWCCLSPSFSILQLIHSCHCSFHSHFETICKLGKWTQPLYHLNSKNQNCQYSAS